MKIVTCFLRHLVSIVPGVDINSLNLSKQKMIVFNPFCKSKKGNSNNKIMYYLLFYYYEKYYHDDGRFTVN
jgi:hypothetical protein